MTAGPASVLVVDDEPPARLRLGRLLAELPGYTLAGEAAHGAEALAKCAELQPDIVLLDIRMPGMDGLEVATHLATLERPPAVIFATACDDRAIQAFDARALDYLLKPVRRERLHRALERAAVLNRARLAVLPGSGPRTQLCVQRPRGVELIPVTGIICFQADNKYVTVHHEGGTALLDESLKALETEFGDRFARIHRHTLLSLEWLCALEKRADGGWQALVRDGRLPPLTVSRRIAGELRRRLRSPS